MKPVLDIYENKNSPKQQAFEYETHLQEFAHSDESLLLHIWGNKVKTCTDDVLMLQQTAPCISKAK